MDDTGQHDLTQLRSFRDWNSRYVLESVTLREKRINENIVVALGCLLFLWHVRSALVAVITLPVAILLSFVPMLWL